MEEEEVRISVVDVYDLASEIGKEFEKIIDRTGADAVTGLMPRVISALEHLERLATRHEATTAYIQELRTTIAHLENEKIGKAEDRQRYERVSVQARRWAGFRVAGKEGYCDWWDYEKGCL